MNIAAPESRIFCVGDVGFKAFDALATRFQVAIECVDDGAAIPGTFWGEPEAGLHGRTVYARADTPVHSVLHELSHLVCMSEDRRRELHRDAGGDDLEESAVCYLQILLGDYVAGVSAAKLCADMDTWGYSFRLGSASRWFAEDADDARLWLLAAGLITAAGEPAFRMRQN